MNFYYNDSKVTQDQEDELLNSCVISMDSAKTIYFSNLNHGTYQIRIDKIVINPGTLLKIYVLKIENVDDKIKIKFHSIRCFADNNTYIDTVYLSYYNFQKYLHPISQIKSARNI
jgi:hypothetical protein